MLWAPKPKSHSPSLYWYGGGSLYFVIWVNWSFKEGPALGALGTYICKLTINHNICYSFTVELSESNWASSRSQPAEEQQLVHSVISVCILSSGLLSQSSHPFIPRLSNRPLRSTEDLLTTHLFSSRWQAKREVYFPHKRAQKSHETKMWIKRLEDIIIYKLILSEL